VARLFAASELEQLAVSPKEEVATALARGGAPDATETLVQLLVAFRNVIRGYAVWAALVQGHLAQQGSPRGSSGGLEVEDAWRVARFHDVTDADLERARRQVDRDVDEVVASRDPLRKYDEIEASYRRLHDAHRDWASALLSAVYRRGGVDDLEACLRLIGEKTLLRWMVLDLAEEPVARLRTWASLLRANFARITIDEDDDAFTIHQDPCGSCTRQVLAGCYGPPLDLAVVREAHPITYGAGDLPVYRCHVAAIHVMMATERTGRPWPRHQCPPHDGAGVCTIRLDKEPARS
jgi:hypothetical protein